MQEKQACPQPSYLTPPLTRTRARTHLYLMISYRTYREIGQYVETIGKKAVLFPVLSRPITSETAAMSETTPTYIPCAANGQSQRECLFHRRPYSRANALGDG